MFKNSFDKNEATTDKKRNIGKKSQTYLEILSHLSQ